MSSADKNLIWQGEIDSILEILSIKDIPDKKAEKLNKWIDSFRESVLDECPEQTPWWEM